MVLTYQLAATRKVLASVAIPFMCYYFFDFPFIFAVGLIMEVPLDGRSRVGWFQQGNVEHWVDLCILRQIESVVD
ncbi:hypothetical protein M3J09_009626 [Ascochyta lentis]